MSTEIYFAMAKEDGPVTMFTSGKGLTEEKVRAEQPELLLVAECGEPLPEKSYMFVAGALQITDTDPLDAVVSAAQVSKIRDYLEEQPLEVSGHYYQVDQAKAFTRFQDAIDTWDIINPVNFSWKRADNSLHLLPNKQALIDLFTACKVGRAIRSHQLHTVADQIKNLPVITKRDLENQGWPTEVNGVN